MPKFNILDAEGNVVNTIVAIKEFVVANYDHWEQDEFDVEREWRDSELQRTDLLAVLPDYPDSEALLAYRKALRDWTDTEDFPNTRPELGA